MNDYKQLVNNKIQELNKITELKYGIFAVPNFVVKYDLSGITSMGMTSLRYKSVTLRLNVDLLEEYGEVYVNEVVVHEYAHMVIRKLYPTKMLDGKKVHNHGKEWKAVCKAYNHKGSYKTSLFDDSKVLLKIYKEQNPHEHNCSCKTHNVSTKIHNELLNGERYTCTDCNSVIL